MRGTKRLILVLALLTIVCGVPLASAQVFLPQGGGSIIGSGIIPCPNEAPFVKVTDGIAGCAADPGAGSGAPTAATYITRTSDGTLSSEQALASLASGLMLNTTTTGVVAIYAGEQCTNQVAGGLDASGDVNCVSITNAHITDGTIQPAKLAFAPIKSGDAAGGDLTGTYPNPTIAPNSIAMGTDTVGRYVGKLTAGDNISLANCPSLENVDCTINATDAQTAAQVPFTPFGTIEATNTQAAIEEVFAEAAGGGGSQTAAEVPFTPNGTIEATDTQAAIQEVRDEAILVTTKDAASGVAGLTSATKLKIAQLGSYHSHTGLSAGSQITPEQLFVGIEGATTPVELTNAQPITGGVANQIAILTGIHADNTVTLTPQTNLVLCGDEPSVTVGPGLQSPWFKRDPTGTIWRRLDCGSGFPFIDRNIVADENNPVCIGDIANGNMQCFFEEAGVNKHQGYTGGVPDTTTHAEDLNVTGDLTVAGEFHGLVHKASLGVVSPEVDTTGFIQIEWPAEVTIQEIQCSTDTGTVDVNLVERARATPNSGGTNTLSASLVCDSDGAVTTTFADAVIAADVPYALLIPAVASSPGVVRVHVKAVRN